MPKPMTNLELINQLLKLPPDDEVVIVTPRTAYRNLDIITTDDEIMIIANK